jgi:sugar phosphate isomerase/epimerase
MAALPNRRLPPDIGLPSDAWYGLQLDVALDRVARYATLAEIASVEDHNLLAAPNRRAAVESGLRLTVHGPYDDLEPGTRRERDRRHALRVHRRHLEAAAEIGAETYVVHPDYQGRAVPRDPRILEALQRTFAELEEYQRELGVRIVVENMARASGATVILELLSEDAILESIAHLDSRGLLDEG